MLFSSLIIFYSPSTGLIGNLNKVTVGTYGGFKGGMACGADLGVKIKIQKPNRDFCSVPLIAFSGGNTMTFEGTSLNDCRSVDFEVGLNSIRFWIYSTEHACINSITLRFSTPQGQVTFMGQPGSGFVGFGIGTTDLGYSLKNQSRKFKKKIYRHEKDIYISHTMCTTSEMILST